MVANKGGYKLYPLARADLEDIWLYTVHKWSLQQADSYHAEMITVFEGLAKGTKTGVTVEVREGYFKYLVGSHVVFYRHSEVGIDIVRVLHQRMDVGGKL